MTTTLQQIEPVDGEVSVIVLCHTRELAYQIKNEYARFSKYMPDVRTGVFYGGTNYKVDTDLLANKEKCPHIVVGTPGRLGALVRDKAFKGASVRHFVLDECDKMLDSVGQSSLLHSSDPTQSMNRRRTGPSNERIRWQKRDRRRHSRARWTD